MAKKRAFKQQRKYSDEQRAIALAALAANGGNIKQTSLQIKIPIATLRHWATGERHPEAAKDGIQKKKQLADAIEDVARTIANSLIGKLDDASLKDAATAFGILIDKMQLLRGEPTNIGEQRGDKLEEFRKRYGQPRVDAIVSVGTNGRQQPVHSPTPLDATTQIPRIGMP